MQNMVVAKNAPVVGRSVQADRSMFILRAVLLLCSFGPMTTAVIRWAAASDLRARAKQAGVSGDLKLADKLGSEAEKLAHQRRNRVSLYLVAWVAGFVPATMLWQHQTGGSYATQVTVLAVSAVVGGWVISLKQTGPAVDMIIAAILLVVNVGTAWVTSPEAATTYAAVSAFCWVAAGVVWRLLNPEQKPPTGAGVAVGVPVDPSGPLTASAVEEAFAAAVPKIRTRLDRAAKEAARTGRPVQPVFSPFTVALSEDETMSATVKLPPSVTAKDLNTQDAMENFASALDMDESQVIIRRGANAGIVNLRLLPKPVHEMPLPVWPHWTRRTLDAERFCVGFNETGKPVFITWAEANSVAMGGMKGTGKTNSLRVVILGLLMQSPFVRVHVFNGKGTGDFNPFNPVLHTHVSGDDEEAADALLQFLRWMVKEASRRAAILKDNVEEFPDMQFTPEHLGPKYGVYAERVIIDEVDTLIEHRPEIGKLLAKLGQKYRATQFGMIFGLQSLVDKKDLSKAAKSCDIVISHYVADYVEAKAILGDGWPGPKPQTFRHPTVGNPKLDGKPIKGLAAIKGGSDQLVRFPQLRLDHPDFAETIEALRSERETKGALTGAAIGEQTKTTIDGKRTVVHAALDLWPKNEHGEPYSSVRRSWIATAVSATDEDWRGATTQAVTQAILAEIGDADKGHQCPPHGEPDGTRGRGFRHDSLLAVAFDLND